MMQVNQETKSSASAEDLTKQVALKNDHGKPKSAASEKHNSTKEDKNDDKNDNKQKSATFIPKGN